MTIVRSSFFTRTQPNSNMSSDLLDFDSYYKSPQDTQKPTFAAYTPRTNELLSFGASPSPSPANDWQQAGKSQWPVQALRQGNVSSNAFGTATTSNGYQSANDPFGALDLPPNAFPRSGPRPSSKTSALPKPGVKRQATLTFFENPIGVSRMNSFDQFDGPIADYIDKKQRQQQSSNTNSTSPAPFSPLRNIVSSKPEILFDADDELETSFDEEDFGEFATATSESLIDDISNISCGNLGDLTDTSMSLEAKESHTDYVNNYPPPPKPPYFRERNPFSDLVLATKLISEKNIRDRDLMSAASSTCYTAWPTLDEKPIKPKGRKEPSPKEIEEVWGDFADLPPETPDIEAQDRTRTDWSWGIPTAVPEQTTSNCPHPTNIPPPSILLPIFQQLFDLPRSALFQPVANQPFSLKNRIFSDPSTIDFLRGYLLISVVAARILAGRKLRWKRDHYLAQSMRIGMASGKGGMKLAVIDKAESAREDREAADTVQIWKEQLGRLRSAVVVANSSLSGKSNPASDKKGKQLIIPEINEVMLVKNAGVSEGAVGDPRACVLCGIKREERIAKVDVAIEDSFGEFWAEHWGHVDCRNFWREHSAKLRQR